MDSKPLVYFSCTAANLRLEIAQIRLFNDLADTETHSVLLLVNALRRSYFIFLVELFKRGMVFGYIERPHLEVGGLSHLLFIVVVADEDTSTMIQCLFLNDSLLCRILVHH